MDNVGFFQKLRYKFDNLMSKGTGILLLSLAIATAGMIALISLIVWFTQSGPTSSFPELLWMGLMRAIDSGTVSGDTGSVFYVFLMFVTTLGGIFILSILIGILTTGIEAKLDSLRKGRSRVIEKDQTIILGWSEQIFTIIEELIEANSNRKHACIVIMGNQDKSEMDDEIRERITDTKTTRIVTRQGNPIDIDDLEIVSLNTSRSIIIIPEDDTKVIKTILAITNNPKRRSEPYNIVTVLRDPQNIQIAQIAGSNQAEIILSDMLISRIIAQTCRQPGLSTVYTELLDFDGDEIYFSDCPEAIGKTFSEALFLFEKSTVIGIQSQGKTYLNPPMKTVLQDGDQIIAISEDDDTIVIRPDRTVTFDAGAIVQSVSAEPDRPEKTLILGWNENAPLIIHEIDNYVPGDSLLTVVSDCIGKEAFEATIGLLKNQKTEMLQGDPKDRSILDELMVRNYDHVILLCNTCDDSSPQDVQESDANTLVVLLQLRDISEKLGTRFSVVSEMMDFRNKKLAEVTKVNDFIVSEKLVSLMLTQISENKMLSTVFDDLFDADGSELYIKNATKYVVANKPVNFYTLVEAARRKNEVVIGYIIAAEQLDAQKNYGIYINPEKSLSVTLTDQDGLIVIAED
ncbi:potassium transporter TrkA [Acetobacterium fimetarium]|uniref:Potassium transporter TrkA n=1 Tax=Acetobacterium fimetarium TaxID=52691 RepID=A0ABR6WXV1_9FIRM|nr:potassium transporter TrkA [Acetobacterium fimetarium]MBC3805316.1 potassium transporter TrkA [Acetobacterium fimetarium]